MLHKTGYIFTDKKNPQKGIMASIFGAISVASIVLAVYLTYSNHGTAPMQYGTVILLAILFAVTGLILGVMSCLEKEIFHFFPILGILLNSIALAAGGLILYIGVSSI